MPCPQVGRVLDVLQAGLCEETDGLARLIRRRLRRQSREAGRQGQGGNRNTSRTRELHDRPVFSSKFQGYDPSSSQRPRREPTTGLDRYRLPSYQRRATITRATTTPPAHTPPTTKNKHHPPPTSN